MVVEYAFNSWHGWDAKNIGRMTTAMDVLKLIGGLPQLFDDDVSVVEKDLEGIGFRQLIFDVGNRLYLTKRLRARYLKVVVHVVDMMKQHGQNWQSCWLLSVIFMVTFVPLLLIAVVMNIEH